MTQIKVLIKKQLLTIQNQEIIASGDSNVDRCIFTFSSEWNDYVKTAVFYQNKTNTHCAVLESDNTCMIPAAAMAKEGNLFIGVFGIHDKKILTSTVDKLYISEGAISGIEISTEPDDGVFLAIIARYQRIIELMQEYDERAKNIGTDYEEFRNSVGQAIQDQNEFLEKLGAFELSDLESRMSKMEMEHVSYGEKIDEENQMLDAKMKEIQDSAFLIKNIQVDFDSNHEFIFNNERITEDCIANAYF